MKYCVIKGMTTVIDGSENPQEVMIQNAVNAGFAESEVEILEEEEYAIRKALEPKPIEQQIIALKAKLTETDYVVIKIAEKAVMMEEYAEVIARRQAWRKEISNLETQC